MKYIKPLIILLTVTILFFTESCKTDFELFAPYDDIPVIFGMLDQTVDTQFVKINKTYRGDGDNTQYARINDSVLFKNVSARVDEIVNGNIVNSYPLNETWKKVEPGIFYGDSQKVYYFLTPGSGLNVNAEYKLEINIDEGRKSVSAKTKLVEDFAFKATFINKGFSGYNFAGTNSSITNQYPKFNVEWTSGKGGTRYEASLRFYYEEYNQNGIELKYLDWFLGTKKTINDRGGEDMRVEIIGDAFYKMIASKLANYPNESNVTQRKFKRIEFRVAAAGEDLATYMEVNEPSNSIVTNRPSFTNIDGGIGVFSSRYNLILSEINTLGPLTLNTSSLNELYNGQYTAGLKFQP